ncbi:hypothetical protein D8S78_11705 [Natrialba swarupiae]|nr:hypothetical protein [Natrialba swarupiae]
MRSPYWEGVTNVRSTSEDSSAVEIVSASRRFTGRYCPPERIVPFNPYASSVGSVGRRDPRWVRDSPENVIDDPTDAPACKLEWV